MFIVENVSKSFYSEGIENKVLKRVSMCIDEGDLVCVVGRSGSGKSTFLNILSTLLKPEQGRVTFRGEDITSLSEQKLNMLRQKDFSMIFQHHYLLAYLTAVENVLLPLMGSLRPISKTQYQQALNYLDRVELNGKCNRLPGQLSGGEQQRVAIARALITSPAVLFADEPTGNLDRKTGDSIIQLIKDLNDEGLTIIMVTHETSYASHADKVVEMEDGKIKTLS